jgi:hypothetical protein
VSCGWPKHLAPAPQIQRDAPEFQPLPGMLLAETFGAVAPPGVQFSALVVIPLEFDVDWSCCFIEGYPPKRYFFRFIRSILFLVTLRKKL